MKKIWIILCFLLLPEISAAFTENTSTPTANNAPLPINTSSGLQVKSGPLVSDSYMQASIFYDRYYSDYYVQPGLTSRLNFVIADNTLTYGNSDVNGESRASLFRDRNDGSFYVDPNSWSIVRNIQADIYYDRNNTGYYVDPSGTNRMNYILADNIYAYGTGNYADVYIRNTGRWASQIGVSLTERGWWGTQGRLYGGPPEGIGCWSSNDSASCPQGWIQVGLDFCPNPSRIAVECQRIQ